MSQIVNWHVQLSLLFADFVVAFGGILNLKWVVAGKSECGGYCSAQGSVLIIWFRINP